MKHPAIKLVAALSLVLFTTLSAAAKGSTTSPAPAARAPTPAARAPSTISNGGVRSTPGISQTPARVLSNGQRAPAPAEITPVRRIDPSVPRRPFVAAPLLPPPVPYGTVRRDDSYFHHHGFLIYPFGPRFGYFGPHFHNSSTFVPAAHPYPYPVLYPEHYDEEWQHQAPEGVWSIVVEFNEREVEAYWDPYVGGYWYYDEEWGYVCVQ